MSTYGRPAKLVYKYFPSDWGIMLQNHAWVKESNCKTGQWILMKQSTKSSLTSFQTPHWNMLRNYHLSRSKQNIDNSPKGYWNTLPFSNYLSKVRYFSCTLTKTAYHNKVNVEADKKIQLSSDIKEIWKTVNYAALLTKFWRRLQNILIFHKIHVIFNIGLLLFFN